MTAAPRPDHAAIEITLQTLAIKTRPYGHPDTQTLVAALHAEQLAQYDHADPVDPPTDTAYVSPDGLFLVAYVHGEPVACGGYHTRADASGDERVVEIKKMYTAPAWRGHGLGKGILTRLEKHAAAAGATRVLLETGVHNTAALVLYTNMGYEPIEAYVAGRDPAVNRAFCKQL
ncbi:MAG: GNAT family N-acetyltransferase, partial [Micromonosporaceae bacterium]